MNVKHHAFGRQAAGGEADTRLRGSRGSSVFPGEAVRSLETMPAPCAVQREGHMGTNGSSVQHNVPRPLLSVLSQLILELEWEVERI